MRRSILLVCLFLAIGTLAIAQNNNASRKEKSDDKESNWNNGWSGKVVKGEGNIVKESRDISGFSGIETSIAANVTLKQGSTFKVIVEGQKNILEVLKTELQGNSLKIFFEKGYNVQYKENLKIFVEAPSFEKLGMSGSGDVNVDGELTGANLDIHISGSGNFNLDNVKYTDLNMGISGSGNVTIGGNSEQLVLSISGSGDVKAGKLKSQNVRCSVSGSGNITCHAQKTLDAKVSGSGDIKYTGNPATIKTKVTGSGDINSF